MGIVTPGRAFATAALTGVSYLGVQVWNNTEGLRDCLAGIVDGRFSACADLGNPLNSDSKPVTIPVENFKTVSEKQIGTVGILGFGLNEIKVQGKITMDDVEENYLRKSNPLPGHPDGTYFMDPKPVSLKYIPCLAYSSDYTRAVNDVNGTYRSNINISTRVVAVTAEDGTVKESTRVVAKTGALAPCAMHIDPTVKSNHQIYRYRSFLDFHPEKESYRRTIEYLGDNLLTLYAQASSCTASNVNLAAAEATVADLTRGFLARDPALSGLVSVPIDVELGDPGEARKQQLEVFDAKIEEFKAMKETLEDSKGNTEEIDKLKIAKDAFKMQKCPEAKLQLKEAP
jgi:hypothetical protein